MGTSYPLIDLAGNAGAALGGLATAYQEGRVARVKTKREQALAAFSAGDVEGAYQLAREGDTTTGLFGALSNRQGPKLQGTYSQAPTQKLPGSLSPEGLGASVGTPTPAPYGVNPKMPSAAGLPTSLAPTPASAPKTYQAYDAGRTDFTNQANIDAIGKYVGYAEKPIEVSPGASIYRGGKFIQAPADPTKEMANDIRADGNAIKRETNTLRGTLARMSDATRRALNADNLQSRGQLFDAAWRHRYAMSDFSARAAMDKAMAVLAAKAAPGGAGSDPLKRLKLMQSIASGLSGPLTLDDVDGTKHQAMMGEIMGGLKERFGDPLAPAAGDTPTPFAPPAQPQGAPGYTPMPAFQPLQPPTPPTGPAGAPISSPTPARFDVPSVSLAGLQPQAATLATGIQEAVGGGIITAGKETGGHKPNGYHPRGLAFDFIPPDARWGEAVRHAMAQGATVIYEPADGRESYPHLHVDMRPGKPVFMRKYGPDTYRVEAPPPIVGISSAPPGSVAPAPGRPSAPPAIPPTPRAPGAAPRRAVAAKPAKVNPLRKNDDVLDAWFDTQPQKKGGR